MECRTPFRLVTYTVALLLAATLSPLGNAQDHNHKSASVIKGSEHPELIPDSVAYRLYFTTVSLPNQPKLQAAQVAAVGLSKEDAKVMIQHLNTFRSAFDALVANYNKAINEGQQPNAKLFDLQQELLLANTRGALNATLSKEGAILLKAYVENEKRHMQISDEREAR